MKKLNVQVYEGCPEEVTNIDNNNLFVTGEVDYNGSGGTRIKSIDSIKDGEGNLLVDSHGTTDVYELLKDVAEEYENHIILSGGNVIGMPSEPSVGDTFSVFGNLTEGDSYLFVTKNLMNISDISSLKFVIAEISGSDVPYTATITNVFDVYLKEKDDTVIK